MGFGVVSDSSECVFRLQATQSTQQWEKRAQQLQQKYGKVDLAEHQRVQRELRSAQAELSQKGAEGTAQLAAVQEKLKKVCFLIQMLGACVSCMGLYVWTGRSAQQWLRQPSTFCKLHNGIKRIGCDDWPSC